MKNLILLFCAVLLFNACKKTENITDQKTTSNYSGIKNVKEFDKVINEITQTKVNSRLLNPGKIEKIMLSKEAIAEMRESIQFDDNKMLRGFKSNRQMLKELSMKEYIFLMENLLGCAIIVYGKDNKIIGNSSEEIFIRKHEAGTHNDWNWSGMGNCCNIYYDATCVTYGGGISC